MYHGVKNDSLSENFAYILNRRSLSDYQLSQFNYEMPKTSVFMRSPGQ